MKALESLNPHEKYPKLIIRKINNDATKTSTQTIIQVRTFPLFIKCSYPIKWFQKIYLKKLCLKLSVTLDQSKKSL